MRSWITTIVSALLASGVAAAAVPPDAPLTIIDTTDEFAQLYERSRSLPAEERGELFRREFATIVPGFYSHERVKIKNAALYDRLLMKKVDAFPQEKAGVTEISRRFGELFEPARKSFEAEFGPMRGYEPIYIVHSLGEFDGGTRELAGGNYLMFGADMMAKYHLAHDIQPFFHHELFHLLHARTFPECDAMWCGLWTEGLATYVAASLNPKATDSELLLTVPEPIRPAVDANRKEAVCAVRQRLGSTSSDDSRALFSSARLAPNLPPRFGYYVGYLVARDLGRTLSLKQLAALTHDQVKPLVEASLDRMADCD